MTTFAHTPVMLKESIQAMNINPDGAYIDATYGYGGHSKEILNIFDLTFKSTKVNSIARPLMEIISGVAIAGIIFIGGSQVILDKTTPGTFF